MTAETPAQESAMTEIALALAMGFFSIMVLTIISMGSGSAPRPEKLSIISLVKAVDENRHSSDKKNVTTFKKQKIIIFDGTQFLDTQFKPVAVEEINSNPETRDELLVLAMPPELSIKDALAAKNRIQGKNLVVSHLNEAWLAALRARK
jgi:hypothetical protein